MQYTDNRKYKVNLAAALGLVKGHPSLVEKTDNHSYVDFYLPQKRIETDIVGWKRPGSSHSQQQTMASLDDDRSSWSSDDDDSLSANGIWMESHSLTNDGSLGENLSKVDCGGSALENMSNVVSSQMRSCLVDSETKRRPSSICITSSNILITELDGALSFEMALQTATTQSYED